MPSTALLTDRYELTMLDAALRDGTADRPCVFEVFTRRLPAGRRYGVVAGLGRVVDAIRDFRFTDDVLTMLDDRDVVSAATLRWLATYRFRGQIHAYREGEIFFPGSPVLTVSASFGDAVVLETLVLSVLNHDTAVASAAARIVAVARGRGLMEFGSRRTHEHAAVAAARATYLAGFSGTSNLAAGAQYGIPTLGTSAHAFTLLHDDEPAAFAAQVAALGTATTLLVDTYNVRRGIDHALAAAGTGLGAIRIDSGDLAAEAHAARDQLDAAGATATRIVVSGDLDEHAVAELADAPVDVYGVGTSVVTGGGHPTAGFVYKLVARATSVGGPCEPVAKAGGDKATVGGRKRATRRIADGAADAELLRDWDVEVLRDGAVHGRAADRPRYQADSGTGERALQVPVVVDGEVRHDPDLDTIRAHHQAALSELPTGAASLEDGEPCLPTIHEHPAHPPTQEAQP